MTEKRLINFVKTFEGFLFNSQKKIKNLYDNEYLNNPNNTEAIWEDDDRIYKMRVSMVSKNKTYCKDCSYSKNEKCYYDEEYQEKKYCPHFTTEKKCWDCVNFKNYGINESWCDLNLEYDLNYNNDNKCPEWKFDGI